MQMWSRFSSSTVQKNDAVDSTTFGGQTSEEGTSPHPVRGGTRVHPRVRRQDASHWSKSKNTRTKGKKYS